MARSLSSSLSPGVSGRVLPADADAGSVFAFAVEGSVGAVSVASLLFISASCTSSRRARVTNLEVRRRRSDACCMRSSFVTCFCRDW